MKEKGFDRHPCLLKLEQFMGPGRLVVLPLARMGTGGSLLRLNDCWWNGVYAEQHYSEKYYEKLLLVINVGGSDCVLP